LSIIFAYFNERPDFIRKASVFTISAGIFFGLSAIERFAGGFAIPVGVPIVIFIGWWMYREYDEVHMSVEEHAVEETARPE
jgi:hypothetical protein